MASSSNSELKAVTPTLTEVFADLSVRFLVNATKDDYTEQRILLLVETAHWYYIDYFMKKYPELSNFSFQVFALRMFKEYPPLAPFIPKFPSMWDSMKAYKRAIPVCGGVILNPQMNRILLVRGVKSGDGFSFPRGKINRGETAIACAAREIYEEAGLSVEHLLDVNKCVSHDARKQHGQFVTLFYVVVDEVGMVTKPTVLNEIGAIQWHSIAKLIKENNRSYLLPNFLPQIEAWVKQHNPNYVPAATHGRIVYDMKNPNAPYEDPKPTQKATVTSFYFDRSKLSACFPTSQDSTNVTTPVASSSQSAVTSSSNSYK